MTVKTACDQCKYSLRDENHNFDDSNQIWPAGARARCGKTFKSCVSLMKNPGGVLAEHHALNAVSKSQPLKHNGERALTRAVHWQIRPAVTVREGHAIPFLRPAYRPFV